MNDTAYAHLTQFSGGDSPKWIGDEGLGTYNGDMLKIDNALSDLNTFKLPVTGGAVGTDNLAIGAVKESIIDASAVTANKIKHEEILNRHVNPNAAIDYTKLDLSGHIKASDMSDASADFIPYSKLNLTDSILLKDLDSTIEIPYSMLDCSGSIQDTDIISTGLTDTSISTNANISGFKVVNSPIGAVGLLDSFSNIYDINGNLIPTVNGSYFGGNTGCMYLAPGTGGTSLIIQKTIGVPGFNVGDIIEFSFNGYTGDTYITASVIYVYENSEVVAGSTATVDCHTAGIHTINVPITTAIDTDKPIVAIYYKLANVGNAVWYVKDCSARIQYSDCFSIYTVNRTDRNDVSEGASVAPWSFSYTPSRDCLLIIQGAVSAGAANAFRASINLASSAGGLNSSFGASATVESTYAWASIPFGATIPLSAGGSSATYTVTFTANFNNVSFCPDGFESYINAYVIPR